MTPQLICDNLLAYSLQIAAVVAVAAALPWMVRLASPRARLLFWRIVLGACLLLPLARPWQRPFIAVPGTITTALATPPPLPPGARPWPVAEMVLAAIALGAAARLGWLALGMLRLGRYRRAAQPLQPLPPEVARFHRSLAPQAVLALSPDVAGPVTFGLRHPVVLVPASFPALPAAAQAAIACHELLHVARRDWLRAVADELVRAVLWFHPAVWFVLSRVLLSREQTVDQEVVVLTESRQQYIDALLAAAGASPLPDLAPAPLFLRRRHLKHRVVSILKESSMSTKRFAPALAAGVVALAAAAWLATGAFPLQASPQVVADAQGVTVEEGNAVVAHRASVVYPEAARRKAVEGTVVVEATVDSTGEVTDARVVSGPEELRRAALESVLQWHFAKGGSAVKTLSIAFKLPAGTVPGATKPASDMVPAMPAGVESMSLTRLSIRGLSPAAEQELRAKLGVSEGAQLDNQAVARLQTAVREFDEHLAFGLTASTPKELAVNISAPGAAARAYESTPAPPPTPGVERVRVGGNAQEAKLTYKPRPVYPPLAKQARIQGTVRFDVLIDTAGNITNLSVVSGHPLLVPSAVEAVKQWTYTPTLLNGKPCEVMTVIDVNYTLMP